jgi:hypothetical protein
MSCDRFWVNWTIERRGAAQRSETRGAKRDTRSEARHAERSETRGAKRDTRSGAQRRFDPYRARFGSSAAKAASHDCIGHHTPRRSNSSRVSGRVRLARSDADGVFGPSAACRRFDRVRCVLSVACRPSHLLPGRWYA